MEDFKSQSLENKNIENVISKFKSAIENNKKLSDERREKILADLERIKIKLHTELTQEVKEYINTLPTTSVEYFIEWCFFDKNHFFKENEKPLSKEEVENIILFLGVRGYGHPEVLEREKNNPVPTVQELMMGCYIEQIEKQTRNAVQILREKGYPTLESGFDNAKTGSQFFHLQPRNPIVFDREQLDEIEQQYNVSIVVEQSSEDDLSIHFNNIENKSKKLEDWEKCLTAFAESIPVVGEADVAIKGETTDFILNTVATFPKETILKTATTQKQKEFVEKIYTCKSEEDITKLFNIDNSDE